MMNAYIHIKLRDKPCNKYISKSLMQHHEPSEIGIVKIHIFNKIGTYSNQNPFIHLPWSPKYARQALIHYQAQNLQSTQNPKNTFITSPKMAKL